MSGKHVIFAVIATIWGLTWIAIKTGVAALPPFLFASLRLLAAGSTLLLLAHLRSRRGGGSLSIRGLYRRILVAAILVNTVTYGMVFWGMQYVPSGLSSVVNLSLIPVGLFTIGLAAGEETYSRRKVAAIVLGIIGLIVLFLPKLDFEGDGLALVGMVALVVGTLAYCWGSILSRPLLRALEPLALSGWLTLWGGAGLMVLALVFEDVGLPTLRRLAELPVLASWLFLVLGGSIIAFTLYLRLLRDWGPTRAGMYAFVSPVIAVVLGMLVLAEPFGSYELVGSTLMLSGAALALRG